jgi:hypothetical protein
MCLFVLPEIPFSIPIPFSESPMRYDPFQPS